MFFLVKSTIYLRIMTSISDICVHSPLLYTTSLDWIVSWPKKLHQLKELQTSSLYCLYLYATGLSASFLHVHHSHCKSFVGNIFESSWKVPTCKLQYDIIYLVHFSSLVNVFIPVLVVPSVLEASLASSVWFSGLVEISDSCRLFDLHRLRPAAVLQVWRAAVVWSVWFSAHLPCDRMWYNPTDHMQATVMFYKPLCHLFI